MSLRAVAGHRHGWDDAPVGQWNNGNRAFVQAFMAKGSMTLADARPVLAAIFNADEAGRNQTAPDDVTEEDFRSYIDAASAIISPFDYEIRSTLHQVTRERSYVFCNSTSDALTQLATIHTAEELAFIKRLLDAIFDKYNTPRAEVLGITSMQALKLSPPPLRHSTLEEAEAEQSNVAPDKGITNTQAERLLASLVAEGWLERSRQGWHTLSVRGLLELRAWLVATYNDPDAPAEEWQRIKSCEACRSIVTVGQRCDNLDCNVRLHDICQASYWRTQRGDENECPKCAALWSGQHFVGERAVTTTEAYRRGMRRSGPVQGRAVEEENGASAAVELDEEDDDMDD